MNKQEQEILIDLWRWKLLSTAAITEMHFEKYRPSSAYNRLWRLWKEGLISTVHLSGKNIDSAFLWTLSPKGYKEIYPELEPPKDQGYRSECIQHDWLVAAIHLGEWLKGLPKECALFSEQQLRKLHVSQYPDWIPRRDDRRPDGYWRIRKGAKLGTVALEVERTLKSPTDYRSIAAFYELEEIIYRVVWLVQSRAIANRIEQNRGAINSNSFFSYVLISDFLKHGWDAKFFLGKDQGITVRELLNDPMQTQCKPVCTQALLNTAKSPHKSKSFTSRIESAKSHRLGSTLVSFQSSSLPSTTPSKGDPTYEK